MERISTGVFGLDELLGGGFVPNTVNAVFGTVGCGKTILSLQFLLEGLETGQECVYVSFDLETDDLKRIASSLGWRIERYIEDELLRVGKFHIEESFLDSELVRFISGRDMRIAIDSFSPLVASLESGRARNEIGWFFKTLRESGTSIITIEEPFVGEVNSSTNLSLFLADCVLHLKNIGYGEIYSRTMRIVKHRMSAHLDGVFPYSIVEGAGIVVEERRCEGFEVDLSDLPLSAEAREKLEKYCRSGVLKREDIEKIRKRVA